MKAHNSSGAWYRIPRFNLLTSAVRKEAGWWAAVNLELVSICLMLVAREAEKPARLKLNSLAEHSASPLITGIRLSFTYIPVIWPE
jgi:hypothetical protein